MYAVSEKVLKDYDIRSYFPSREEQYKIFLIIMLHSDTIRTTVHYTYIMDTRRSMEV